MTRVRMTAVVLAAVGVLLVATAPALAAVSLDISTTYSGTEADSQVVDVEMTISPDGGDMTDVTIDIGETDRGFVDFESFSTTVTPGSSDVDATYQGDGRFTIAELPSDVTVTISYQAYPRTIKQESVTVSTVSVSYVQNGQELSESRQVNADLSDSAWFALQDAQAQNEQLQLWGLAGRVLVGAAVAGLAIFGYLKYRDGGGDEFDDGGGDF